MMRSSINFASHKMRIAAFQNRTNAKPDKALSLSDEWFDLECMRCQRAGTRVEPGFDRVDAELGQGIPFLPPCRGQFNV